MAALGLALALPAAPGCGGGDDQGSESVVSTRSRESTTTSSTTTTSSGATHASGSKGPAAAVEDVLVGGDCRRHIAAALVRSAYGGVPACRQAVASGGTAGSLAVRSVDASGDSATIVVVPRGGPSAGERLAVELTRADGTWQVDSLESNAPVGP
jgi:hypothetical protein